MGEKGAPNMAPRFWKNRHIHDSREIKTKEDKTKGVFQAFFLAAEKDS